MATPTDSRTVRVFLSSTFRDFAEERDLLVRKVFPELRRKCRERQVELVDVDLRWGITEKEAQQGKVLPICLAEVDRSRPWFMGFIGERYGWVPAPEQFDPAIVQEQPWLEQHRGGKSVTELEILHGVLNNPKMAGRAFFYFRDSKWSKKKGGSYLSEGIEEKAKLEELKERIRQSGFPVLENYLSPEALVERVKEDLWKLIDEAYPESEVPDALTRERMAHEAYGATRRRLYLGGEAYFKALDEAMKAKAFRPVLITGQSGGGKSALVANWVERWSRKHPKTAVIVHHLGSSSDAADPVRMAMRLMREISRLTGDEFKPESDPDKQMELLPQWLALASAWAQRSKKELLIVLDGLDKVSDRKHLRWLPGFLPPKVKLVASCLHGEILESAKGRLAWQELKVKPFIKTEQRNFIGEYLGRYRKALTAKQIKTLQSHPLSGNPLFLLTVLEELRVFGVHEKLEQRMRTLLSAPPSKGEGEAPTVDDVFEHVLARIEKDLGKKGVQYAMEAIWASRAGLHQDELLAITKLAPAKWAAIQNALDESLYESNGKISFGHDYLRKAVEDRYGLIGKRKLKLHGRLAEWFAEREVDQRVADELPWQWRQAEAKKELVSCLLKRDVFEFGFEKDEYELLRYWLWTGANVETEYVRVWDQWRIGLEKLHEVKIASCISALLRSAEIHGSVTLIRLGIFRLEGAERFARRAVDLCMNCLGQDHLETLASMNNLALVFKDQGESQKAISLFSRVLLEKKIQLGLQHSSVLDTELHLADVFFDQRLYKEAEEHYRQVLRGREKIFGRNHLVTAEVNLKLADLLSFLDNEGSIETECLYKAALNCLVTNLGASNEKAAVCSHNLAVLYESKGEMQKAKQLYCQALAAAERALGPDHSQTLFSLERLESISDCDDAIRIYTEALERHCRAFGDGEYRTLEVVISLAKALRKRSRDLEALALLRRHYLAYEGTLERTDAGDALEYEIAKCECICGDLQRAKQMIERYLDHCSDEVAYALEDNELSKIHEFIEQL
jgi:nephrocystin-3